MESIISTIFIFLLSILIVVMFYLTIKMFFGKNIITKENEDIVYISSVIILFLILIYIILKPTIVNKVIYDNFYIKKNKDLNNISFILYDKNNDNYIIKNIPTSKLIIKESNSNKFEIITCKDYKVELINIFNKDIETCKEKGYNEGENYILYIKEDIKNFLNN